MHQLVQSLNTFLLNYMSPFYLKILVFFAIGIAFLILYLCYKIITSVKGSKQTASSDLVYLKYALPEDDRFEINKR